jgi:hypothetical protein
MKYPDLYNSGWYQKTFPYNMMDEDQLKKFLDWDSNKPVSRAVDGAHYTFKFTPTGLGMVFKVQCGITGDELDLTDYDSW